MCALLKNLKTGAVSLLKMLKMEKWFLYVRNLTVPEFLCNARLAIEGRVGNKDHGPVLQPLFALLMGSPESTKKQIINFIFILLLLFIYLFHKNEMLIWVVE